MRMKSIDAKTKELNATLEWNQLMLKHENLMPYVKANDAKTKELNAT